MPYRAAKNCSELLDMTQTCPTKCSKLLEKTQAGPQKLLKTAQSCSLTMGQQVTKGDLQG